MCKKLFKKFTQFHWLWLQVEPYCTLETLFGFSIKTSMTGLGTYKILDWQSAQQAINFFGKPLSAIIIFTVLLVLFNNIKSLKKAEAKNTNNGDTQSNQLTKINRQFLSHFTDSDILALGGCAYNEQEKSLEITTERGRLTSSFWNNHLSKNQQTNEWCFDVDYTTIMHWLPPSAKKVKLYFKLSVSNSEQTININHNDCSFFVKGSNNDELKTPFGNEIILETSIFELQSRTLNSKYKMMKVRYETTDDAKKKINQLKPLENSIDTTYNSPFLVRTILVEVKKIYL